MFRTLCAALGLTAVSMVGGSEAHARQVDPEGGDRPTRAVSLAGLLAQADSANPRIVAARRSVEAAAARIPQAGALPDPTVGVGVMNVPVADPGLGGEMMAMAQVQVGARLPWPGKLGRREDMARLRAEAAGWELERVRQEVLARVKSTYYRVYFVERALEVTRRNERLVGDFAHLSSARYAVGSGAQPDVLKAQVQRTELADQRVVLLDRRASAVAKLNALVGRPTDTPVAGTELPDEVRTAALAGRSGEAMFASGALADVLPDQGGPGALPSAGELQAQALANNPMIQAHRSRVAAQERALALAETSKLPDLSVSAGYSHRSGFGDLFNFMISAPIPVFSGRKQDQAVVEETARLAERGAGLQAMIDELDAEIASLASELRRAWDQLVLLEDGILPQARAGLASATASYRVGGVDFLTLLDTQVTLYRHELDYHRLLTDFATNLAALEAAVGTEVLP